MALTHWLSESIYHIPFYFPTYMIPFVLNNLAWWALLSFLKSRWSLTYPSSQDSLGMILLRKSSPQFLKLDLRQWTRFFGMPSWLSGLIIGLSIMEHARLPVYTILYCLPFKFTDFPFLKHSPFPIPSIRTLMFGACTIKIKTFLRQTSFLYGLDCSTQVGASAYVFWAFMVIMILLYTKSSGCFDCLWQIEIGLLWVPSSISSVVSFQHCLVLFSHDNLSEN